MKRVLILLMIICTMLALFVGCKKDEKDAGSIGVVAGADNNEEESQNDVNDVDSEEIEYFDYVIYLKHDKLPYIFGERFDIASNDPKLKEKSIEQIALEHLINYKQVESFVTPIPKDTNLLGIKKEDSKVYLDLSKEFVDNMKKDEDSTKIAIAAIVNTLTFFPENEEVFINIEGKSIEKLNGVKMNEGFKFSSDFVPDK